MFFRYFLFFTLTVYVTAALKIESNSSNVLLSSDNDEIKSHNLIVGYRVPGDWLLQEEDIVREKAFLQVITETITFTGNGKALITQIQALDKKINGNGAYATIISGGVGETYVTIKFKSQRNHSIRFKVKIYGRIK